MSYRALKPLQQMVDYMRASTNYRDLLVPFGHSAHIRRHRARIIASRVGLLSLVFSIVVPLWIIIDFIALPWPTWGILGLLRLGAAGVFLSLFLNHHSCRSLRAAYLLLGGMLSVAPLFYLIVQPFLMNVEGTLFTEIMVRAYALLPFVVVAGLSIFPLTAIEVLLSGVGLMIVIVINVLQQPFVEIADLTTTLWLMALVIGVSVVSGMSQLNYMISLINLASKDSLTGAFTRRSGEEYLDLQFRIASRTKTSMSLLFLDVDNFKDVNDTFGHDQGDLVLKQVANGLQNCLRRSDQLIRWGGEEFIVLLPNTDIEHVVPVLNRLGEVTLGKRPDGAPVTVSIGIAELQTDKCEDWLDMVDKADHRMYEAKKSGRNRSVGPKPILHIDKLIA